MRKVPEGEPGACDSGALTIDHRAAGIRSTSRELGN